MTKLDTVGKIARKAGVAGHSQGAIGASFATKDEIIGAAVLIGGGGITSVPTVFLTSQFDFMRFTALSGYRGSAVEKGLVVKSGTSHTEIAHSREAFKIGRRWLLCHLAGNISACKALEVLGSSNCPNGVVECYLENRSY